MRSWLLLHNHQTEANRFRQVRQGKAANQPASTLSPRMIDEQNYRRRHLIQNVSIVKVTLVARMFVCTNRFKAAVWLVTCRFSSTFHSSSSEMQWQQTALCYRNLALWFQVSVVVCCVFICCMYMILMRLLFPWHFISSRFNSFSLFFLSFRFENFYMIWITGVGEFIQ